MENFNALGEIFAKLLGSIIILGITGGVIYYAWNYGLYEITSVGKIKYYQTFLLILGWRSLIYKPQ